MRGRLARSFLTLTAAVLALAAIPAAASARSAQDPVPIGPNQYFKGLINNHPPGQAVIYVICPGPATTGHPVGNQPVEVQPASPTSTTDLGYTGSLGNKITAAIPTPTVTIVLATFTNYFVPQYIPTNITLPCSGTRTVSFIPSPTSGSAKTATLSVQFINLGV